MELEGLVVRAYQNAFTLIELLVVIAVIAILAAMLLPAFSRATRRAQGIQCAVNQKQLSIAWMGYTSDSADRLPFAGGGDPAAWCPSSYGPYSTDYGDQTISPLLLYIRSTGDVWRCPGRPRDPWDVPVNQVMNQFVGGLSWGDDWRVDPAVVYHKLAEVREPARLFLFTDERNELVDTVLWIHLLPGWDNPATYRNPWPAISHNRAAAFAFVDGHSEIHRWRDPRTYPDGLPSATDADLQPNNQDIAWLQQHAVTPKAP